MCVCFLNASACIWAGRPPREDGKNVTQHSLVKILKALFISARKPRLKD